MSTTKRRQFLDWKPPAYDHGQVFRACLAAAKRYHKKVDLYKQVQGTNLAGKFILFQLQNTGGSVVQKYLEACGCPDITNVDSEDQLFDILTSIPVLGIIFWYAPDKRNCVDVLHRMHANRQLPRRPIMVINPGEEALTSFLAATKPILYDTAEQIPSSRVEFASKLSEWFAKADQPDSPRFSLANIRNQIRLVRLGSESTLTDSDISSSLQSLVVQPVGQFWIDAELVAYYVAVGNWNRADHYITKLEANSNDGGLLPNLMRAGYLAAMGDAIGACSMLLERIHGQVMTDDQMIQIGRQIARWKNLQSLEMFLNYWHGLAGPQRGHSYASMVADYLRLTRHHAVAVGYLNHVLAKAPFRWEYLSAMAENRLFLRDYRMAEHYWIVARHHPYADTITWAIGLIRSHYGQRRVRHADGLLAQMLRKYPNNQRLLHFKETLANERLDQVKASS
jgi:hypothetical protein